MTTKSIIELSEPVFCSVLLLSLEGEVSTEEIKKEFAEDIKEFANALTSNGYSSFEMENAKYALCAWVDEYIYANSAISAKWFSHSLALSEFGDAEAGKHFFDRMDALHKNANYNQLLELYAKCILFGFMGKFRMGEHSELKQILNTAISKTNIFLEPINYKPASKTKHRFSFRRGIKNILITGLCETECKEFAKKEKPPKGYKYIYSDMKNTDGLPFLDGIVIVNPLKASNYAEFEFKAPIYRVADLEIPEIDKTLDRNYEFNSNHLNYYLHKYFLDEAACKNILSLPRKLELFKMGNAFYSLPFFLFLQSEKPLAYSLTKRVALFLFLASLLFSIIFFVVSIINQYKEEIKTEAIFLLQKRKLDSLKAIEDSLKLEFENRLRNLELCYQKEILEKFPFKEGKIPSVAEVSDYFESDGEFQKFMDIIDTTSDERIKFNKKTLAELTQLKNSLWSDIPISIVIKAPKMASVKFWIDSQYVEIEQGGSKNLELFFPIKNSKGIELTAKTANNVFYESIKGEWSLLKIGDKYEFSFMDKSYSVDVELQIHWHLPKNSLKPSEWFALRLEPNLIKNLSLTRNLGE
ncbi:MAG: DotU family type IV/VI secretion system protein [Fibromonadaceae bacterium]|jgi:type IV/VI secretion system ImpK/VasF family protein|nr:DotU family type IV/VI secretion system protein [Fibromonadaceae bacterium]